jgi:hypothetical protein
LKFVENIKGKWSELEAKFLTSRIRSRTKIGPVPQHCQPPGKPGFGSGGGRVGTIWKYVAAAAEQET